MDVQEQKYRKVITQYRNTFNNILSECPISFPNKQSSSNERNLKYITMKAALSDNYPFYNSIYQEAIEDIKTGLTDNNPQIRALAIRLARVLPFIYRIKLIEMCQNELTNAVINFQKREKDSGSISGGYNYECAADFSDILLSVFELSSQNQEVYFDVNQRILTMFSRFFQAAFQGDRNMMRNGCEVLRSIFCTLGYTKARLDNPENKLVSKLINVFIPSTSFVNRQDASILNSSMIANNYLRGTNNARLFNIILKCREIESRIRGRLLFGFCCLLGYLPHIDFQITDLLTRQIFQLITNVTECDVILDCFSCLCALATQQQPYSSRSSLIKRWTSILSELSFKKEYFEYYIILLDICNESEGVPKKMSYELAMNSIQITRHISQQYSRFLIYNQACKIILGLSRQAYRMNPTCNFLLKIFQYDWFIDRINLQNDLFKSQFLISLLHSSHSFPNPTTQELLDLLDLAHRLIDWKCTSKQETHIPTLKLAFDMYLFTLGQGCRLMSEREGAKGIQGCVQGLINRCNDPSIYFLFKFKLIARLLELGWYQQNFKYLQTAKLNFQFIQDQIRVVMMPKNPKPIFSYQYSLTFDGEIESRKEIEYIKIIMNLLSWIPKIHEAYSEEVEKIITDYHQYLNELQMRDDANKELINCLQTLEADYYFNQPQKYFLFASLMPSKDLKTLNYETNLQEMMIYTSNQTVSCEDQINIFGPMSPVQLAIKLHPHSSFTSVYIHIKKNQWVQTQNQLKLVVSSGIQKKQVPFQSSILQIKIDRLGALHFEVIKGMENEVLLGSGSYRIKRKLKWKRADHLQMIDGIHTKAYFKQAQNSKNPETYLSCYYGEPLLIKIAKHQNEVVVGLSNKEIWNQIRDFIPGIIQELTQGTAQIVEY